MRPTHRVRCALLLELTLAAACGGSSEPASGDPSTSDADGEVEVESYQELIGQVQTAAEGYLVAMTANDAATMADCHEIHDDYDHRVRAWLGELIDGADAMDAHMMGHGHHAVADMACVMAGLRYELDDHHARACTSPDPGTNRDEAQRHFDRMSMGCAHAWNRCEELVRGLDDGVWEHDPVMHGCEDWDGCCSSNMHGCCDGHMAWMHPACCED